MAIQGKYPKKKKCVKATAFPCGSTCLPRKTKAGKDTNCKNILSGQAKTATLWLAEVEKRMAAINEKRLEKGRSSFYVNDRSRIQPAKSTVNPSGLSDRDLQKAFLAETKNKKSSTLLLALEKELDRRKAKEPDNIPRDRQELYDALVKRLAKAGGSEKEYLERDIQDLRTLHPGISPTMNKATVTKREASVSDKEFDMLTQEWDNLIAKKETAKTPPKKAWEQSFDEFAKANYSSLVKKEIANEIHKRDDIAKAAQKAKSEGRTFMTDAVLKDTVDRANKNIAALKSIKTYEDAQKVWGEFGTNALKNDHKKAIEAAIADVIKISADILKDHPKLIKEKPTIRTGPKPIRRQSSGGLTHKQKTYAAIIKSELFFADSKFEEDSAIAMVDRLKSSDPKTANRIERVLNRIAEDDSDRMTRWVLDHQDLTPAKLRQNLDAIESSLGLSKTIPSNSRKLTIRKNSPREKVDMGGFDFSGGF
jgi:hypothetical protein